MPRPYRRVVVAVDFSAGSEEALRAAERLRSPGTTLYLVHAVDTAPVSVGLPTPVWGDVIRQIETAARRQLERLAARVQARLGKGARLVTHLEDGSPHAVICRRAKRLGADLIVVGTHGRTGLSHVVLGSVAERVVRHAGRPVLVVPIRRRGR